MIGFNKNDVALITIYHINNQKPSNLTYIYGISNENI